MRKKHLRATRRILAGVLFLTSLASVKAQVPEPSAWSSFVNGDGNVLLVDTFMRQSFLNQPTDNWKYTAGGGAMIPEGKKSMQLPAGGYLSFASFPAEAYQDVTIKFRLGADKLEIGEDLNIRYLHDGKMEMKTLYAPVKDDDFFNYKNILIAGSSLEMEVSTSAENALNGYYVVNTFTAFGSIPRYSLFSGNGNWNDTARWSHLPPLRNRSALINGNLEVNTQLACRQLMIGNGSVAIREEGDCRVDTLALCAGNPSAVSDVSLTVAGNLAVNKRLELHYTFPEKGKWYFLSFPFDVSQAGIDPRFQLKDDTFTGQGDYLYVQVYDGNKRAQNNEAQGNWTVLPADQSAGALVFRRGKGYLVALDAAASDQTLTFSAESSLIPDDFGKTATVPVYTSSSANAGEAHRGWYLCGNPLPSPLALSQILPDQALDGNVYLYDGTGYKAYPFGSNYQLPPFAAFFVKATADTEIKLLSGRAEAPAVRLKSGQALHAAAAEPEVVAVGTSSLTEKKVECSVRGKILSLSGLSSAGMVHVMDISGRCVYRHPVLPGSSNLPLPLPSGFYVINLVTEEHHSQYKCILAQ